PELRRAARPAALPLAGATALLALVGATHIGQAVLLALVLARVARGETAGLPALLAAVAAVVLARALLSRAQRLLAVRAGALVRVRLRDDLLAHLGRTGPGALAGARPGAVRATLVDGVEGVDAYVSRYLPHLMVTCALPPLLLVAVALVEPQAVAALAPALLLALAGPRLWDRLLARRGREHWDSYEALAADHLEALQGMATLRAAGAVGRTRARLERRSAALHRATVAKMRVSLADTGLTDLAVQGGTVAAVLVACAAATTGSTTATGTYLLLMLASECFRPVRDLSREWHAGHLGLSAVDGIAALRHTKGGVPDEGTAPAEWATPPEVRFENVHFTHPGRARPALTGVAFTAPAGRVTALVGPSGAGKSTLLSLLLRQRDPEAGRITVGGLDTAAYRLDALRRGIAVVSQDTYLFRATVADNLRLALARALLADAPVLLLDEATSAVDERAEARITRELLAAGRGRTCLLVAHRLEAVRHADHIVVLDHGRVEAAGTHPQLLAAGGLYARLVAAGRTGTGGHGAVGGEHGQQRAKGFARG
ncbi:ATP-binding cassette domain-containing protein, partial [Streptomyces sp. McG5]|uniref:ATP-binding cassette domain-containing protein n=1 Tax=Streptomyces sp. McG5 TaxID=2725484 RepID=UPI00203696D5